MSPPSRTMAVPALVTMLSLAVSTCSHAPATWAPPPPCETRLVEGAAEGALVVEVRTHPLRPCARLSWGDRTTAGTIGSSCWRQGPGVEGCFDTVPDVVAPAAFVAVRQGTELRVLGDATSITGYVGTVVRESGINLDVVQELRFAGGTAVIDVPPGRYTLAIEAGWPRGMAPFYFGVDVG